MAYQAPLWRAIVVFRIVSLCYAAGLFAHYYPGYAHPLAGVFVLVGMAAWTGYASFAYASWRREGQGWTLLVADLAAALVALLATPFIETAEQIDGGVPTLPSTWIAGPVLAWAVSGGRRQGAVAAAILSAGRLAVQGSVTQALFNGVVLLFLAGVVVGHFARLARDSEDRLARALEIEASSRERERLARSIHDSVLQVLALMRRRGAQTGGEAAEIGRLAGEQETALRALIGTPAISGDTGAGQQVDLRTLLMPRTSETVSVSSPGTPVLLDHHVGHEIAEAVGAALDNVCVHGEPGTRAWVLVEDEDDLVTVSVRDDGSGMAEGRLAEAEADGRLGVAQSIRGRVRDLGGSVTILSAPDEGTEVELRVPRSDASSKVDPRG